MGYYSNCNAASFYIDNSNKCAKIYTVDSFTLLIKVQTWRFIIYENY